MKRSSFATLPVRLGKNLSNMIVTASIVVIALAVACSTQLFAQTAGLASISGTVADSNGAILPGATVTAANNGTGQKVVVITSESGFYTIQAIPVGSYTVTASANGFQTHTQLNFVLVAEQSATINFKLTVGAQTETVTVQSSAATLETETAAMGQTVGAEEITELPLNGRSPGSLVTLSPGVVVTMPTTLLEVNPSDTSAVSNAGRRGDIYFTLDGAGNMDPSFGVGAPVPNPDATEEFSVITNNASVQYGFAAGGVVSIVTKSGTNHWHGDGFEFLRNYDLDARNYFSGALDTLKRNQFGGAAGGPILHNKLFIFGNYQRTLQASSSYTGGFVEDVPNAAELGGDFSSFLTGKTANLCGSGGPSNLNFDTGQLFKPVQGSLGTPYVCPPGSADAGQTVYVKTPYAGNQLNPAPTTAGGDFDPVALNINAVLPSKNNAPSVNPQYNEYIVPDHDVTLGIQEFTIRADYNISDKHRVFGHVFLQNQNLPLFGGQGDILASSQSTLDKYLNYNVGWVATFTPKIVNTLTFSFFKGSYGEVSTTTDSNGKPIDLSTLGMGISSPTNFPLGIEALEAAGYFFGPYGYSQVDPTKNYTISEDLSISRGKNLIVAGVDVLHYNWDLAASWLELPLVYFTGQATGNSLADFLTGSVGNFEQGGGQANQTVTNSLAAFAQDTYHPSPRLTLIAGVRWEPYLPTQVIGGGIATYRPGQQSTVYPNAPVGMVFPGDQGITNTGGVNTAWGLFSPRVGFSYQPSSLPNSDFRGAFGFYRSTFDNDYYRGAGSEAPFSPTFNFNYDQFGPMSLENPWGTTNGGVNPFPTDFELAGAPPPPSSRPIALPITIGDGFNPGFKLGTTLQWNFSVQKQLPSSILVTAGYVGAHSYHLPLLEDSNEGTYALLGGRPNTNFGQVLQIFSGGSAIYNAAELTVQKNMSHGLTVTSNYTRSRALDTLGDPSYTTGPYTIGNPDLRYSWGTSSSNYPNVWDTTFVYKTPSFSQLNQFAQHALGSWEGSGIFTLHSGTPFSVTSGSGCANGGDTDYSSDNGYILARADTVPGQTAAVMQGGKSQWLKQYFNTAAFQCGAVGTWGDSAKNLLAGPRFNNWDLALGKNFPIKERYRIQIRIEMFDAFNTPHFANPNSAVGQGGYGQITSLANGTAPRIMQAAGKVYF